MILTPSEDDAERLRRLRHHGMDVPDTVRHGADEVVRESYVEVAYNYRLTDIQAAVGIEQMRRLDSMLDERRRLAAAYDELLAGHARIATPTVPEDVEWNVQSYAVRLAGFDARARDGVMQELLDRGISTRPGVMTAHREPAYADHPSGELPVSERASDGSMVLPLYPGMPVSEVEETVTALIDAVDSTDGP